MGARGVREETKTKGRLSYLLRVGLTFIAARGRELSVFAETAVSTLAEKLIEQVFQLG